MGRPGTIAPDGVRPGSPILQVGGAQEAVRMAPPELLRAVALLLAVLAVLLLKAMTSGSEVLQVRGRLANGVLLAVPHNVSTATAVTGTLLPLFTVIEFPASFWPPIWGQIAWTRQVVNG